MVDNKISYGLVQLSRCWNTYKNYDVHLLTLSAPNKLNIGRILCNLLSIYIDKV